MTDAIDIVIIPSFPLLNPEYHLFTRQSHLSYCVGATVDGDDGDVVGDAYCGERIDGKGGDVVCRDCGVVVDYCNLTETFVAFADEGGEHLLVDLDGVGRRLDGTLHLAARKRRVYPHKRGAEKDGLQLLSKKERSQEQKHCENCPKF